VFASKSDNKNQTVAQRAMKKQKISEFFKKTRPLLITYMVHTKAFKTLIQ
jgi:hypothetical protein